MSAGWLGLIELALVFGAVSAWCWNELRQLRRDRTTALAEKEAQDGSSVGGDEARSGPANGDDA